MKLKMSETYLPESIWKCFLKNFPLFYKGFHDVTPWFLNFKKYRIFNSKFFLFLLILVTDVKEGNTSNLLFTKAENQCETCFKTVSHFRQKIYVLIFTKIFHITHRHMVHNVYILNTINISSNANLAVLRYLCKTCQYGTFVIPRSLP